MLRGIVKLSSTVSHLSTHSNKVCICELAGSCHMMVM